MMMRRTLARSAEQYVRPRCWHSTTSNAGGSSEKLDELEPGVARVARDREDRRERGLQAFVLARVGRRYRLQERAVRRELRLQQERHLQHARALGEALADALLFGERVGGVVAVVSLLRVCAMVRPPHGQRRGPMDSSTGPGALRSLAWWLAATSRWRRRRRVVLARVARPCPPSAVASEDEAERPVACSASSLREAGVA